jgi:hypothetical protein
MLRFLATTLVALGLLSLCGSASANDAADSLRIDGCSFGEVYQFAKAGCTFKLENTGATPLSLTIVPVQAGISTEPSKLTIGPGSSAEVASHVLTDNIAGEIAWTFRIEGAGKEPHFARASGFVMSLLDDPHPIINFGPVDPTKHAETRSITLVGSVDSSFKITRVLSAEAFLHAKIGADGRTLSAEIDGDAPWGPFDQFVKVAVDSPLQKQLWIEVVGDIAGEIGPRKNPFWLGEIPWQAQRTLTVPLFDRDGRDFRIGKVASHELSAGYDSAPCEPAQAGCRNLLIRVTDDQPPGFFKNTIDVELVDRKNHLNLTIWGILGAKPEPGESAPPPAVSKLPLPLAPKPDDAPPPPLKTQPDPPGEGPLLKWTIAQQSSVQGYQVFRGESAEGPFVPMGKELIPVLDNGSGPASYRWRDVQAEKGRAYWYYIAVMYKSGERKALSEPQKTIAK